MVILKIDTNSAIEFERKQKFIPLQMGADFNYYLVETNMFGYDMVDSIPNLNNIVKGAIESITEYVTYLSNEKIKEDISKLQTQLQMTDYKVLKFYEYSLMGKERPYVLTEIHSERQSLRDKINVLQEQIKPVKTWSELENIIIDNIVK